MSSMGNLEKLGILVMVILVVVVGVVAITPQERVAQALRDPSGVNDEDISDLEVVPTPARKVVPRRAPLSASGGENRGSETDARSDDRRERWPPLRGEGGDDGNLRSANLNGGASSGGSNDNAADDDVDARERWRREFDRNGGRGAEADRPAPVSDYREYTLKAEDRLFAIARTELGDGSRWQEILDLNPSLNPRRLSVGTRILLPKRRAAADRDLATPRPGIKTREVKKGDTLSAIAASELGSARKWRVLLDANRDLLSAPEDLRIGMKLRIPNVPSESAPLPAPETGGATNGTVYEVVRGDTLSAISSAQLGTAKRWKEIMALNGLRNANELQPGMKLRMPSRTR